MASVPFNNLITFSRGSNATLTGSNGLVQWAPNNLLTFSEQFDNATWQKFDGSISANTIAAPNGTITADRLTATAGTGLRPAVLQSAIATVATTTYTASFYVRPGTYTFLQIFLNAQTGEWVNYTLSGAGTATANGSCTASILLDGATGWYRITMTYVAGGTDRYPIFTMAASGTATRAQTWNPAGTETVSIWGAQLELGSAATTYNSTTVKNLLGFSEAFDNAGWNKANASIVTGAQANPVNGAFNAQKLMENTAAGTHYALQSASVLAAPYALSVYAKAGERSFISLAFDGLNAWFNLSTGALGTVEAGLTASIVSVGSGWYRCSVFRTVAVAGSKSCVVYPASANGVVSYTGDGNSGVYIYGAQLSDSASLDPYVPTPAAAPSSTAFYGPRFDYDPVTLAPKGLLVEEARTNLVLTSAFQTLAGSAGAQYPSGTGWSNFFNTGGTRTYVASSVFTGAQAMDVASVSAARNVIGFSFAAASSTTYTVSFYVESVSGVTGVVAYATGALGTGGTTNNVTAPTTTGRYTYTFTTGTGAGTVDLRFGIGAAANENGSIRISNVQCEAGAFATSYIPTVASTVTRAADVATISGSLFSQWYGQTEGTLLAEGTIFGLNVTAASGITAVSNGSSAENTAMFRSGGANNLTGEMRDGGVTQATFTTPLGSQPFKVALAYATNNTNLAQNGTVQTTDTACTTPTVDRLVIGAVYSAGDFPTNGHIRSINYIPARAADFQLQALTT